MKLRTLAELAALKEAMRQAAADAQREAERAAKAQRERNLFALTVGEVMPLRQPPRALSSTPRPEAVARQRELDEAAVLVEAISDQFDVESLLETDDSLSFRRRDIGPDVLRKLRRGVWSIQAQLDLHGLRREQARERLGAFLHEVERAGLRCVRIVHGKGNGSPGREPVLKAKVRSWLVQNKLVIAFVQARASEGGHGAVVVLLRPVSSRGSLAR